MFEVLDQQIGAGVATSRAVESSVPPCLRYLLPGTIGTAIVPRFAISPGQVDASNAPSVETAATALTDTAYGDSAEPGELAQAEGGLSASDPSASRPNRSGRRVLRAATLIGLGASACLGMSGCESPVYYALNYATGIGSAAHGVVAAGHAAGNVIHFGGDTIRVFNRITHYGEDTVVYSSAAVGISIKQLWSDGINCVYRKGLFEGPYNIFTGHKEQGLAYIEATTECGNTGPSLGYSESAPSSASAPAPHSHTTKLIDASGGDTEFDEPSPMNPWAVGVDGSQFKVYGPNNSESPAINAGQTIDFQGDAVTVFDKASGGQVNEVWLELVPLKR